MFSFYILLKIFHIRIFFKMSAIQNDKNKHDLKQNCLHNRIIINWLYYNDQRKTFRQNET